MELRSLRPQLAFGAPADSSSALGLLESGHGLVPVRAQKPVTPFELQSILWMY